MEPPDFNHGEGVSRTNAKGRIYTNLIFTKYSEMLEKLKDVNF